MVTFNGEETTALVFDFGSSTSKVGYGGEDGPRSVFPSFVGNDQNDNKMVGESALYRPRPGVDIKSPFDSDSLVEDWDSFEQLWDFTYTKALRAQPKDHPIMFVDPSWDVKANREKLCELAFEKFGVPGFYLGRSAVLSAFAAGRATALVIDSGASNTSIVPIFDGYIVKRAIRKSPMAGNFMTTQTKSYLQSQGIDLSSRQFIESKMAVPPSGPPQCVKRSIEGVTSSYLDYSSNAVVNEFKEAVCQIADGPFNERSSLINSRELRKRPPKSYEFATGFNTLFGIERFQIGESMFSSTINGNPQGSIPQLIVSSLNSTDNELQVTLSSNVILTGANSLLNGFTDRINSEVQRTSPGGRAKVAVTGSTADRKYGPWIGGSILSSVSSFHQLWITKAQYEETGVSVEKKIH